MPQLVNMVARPLACLADLNAARTERRSSARDLFESLLREDFYATPPGSLERTVREAKRDEYRYEHYFGEPMPPHLRNALLLEVELWIRLYDQLRATVPEHEYATLCARLRPTASALLDVLALEAEMCTNPLTAYYERAIGQLRGASR
jgi:hypothetical protein